MVVGVVCWYLNEKSQIMRVFKVLPFLFLLSLSLSGQTDPLDIKMPVRGFCIAVPQPVVATAQFTAYKMNQSNVNDTLNKRYLGMMQTVRSSAESFIQSYHASGELSDKQRGPADCSKALFMEIKEQNR